MTVLAVMLVVTCSPAANMTPEQRACCAAMKHDCGRTAIERSCCPGEASRQHSVAPAKPAGSSVSAPAQVIVAILQPLPEPVAASHRGWFESRLSLEPPGIPTFLFVSALRI
jgi:hypothetical protein